MLEIKNKFKNLKIKNFIKVLSTIVKSTRPTCNDKIQNL